VGAAKVHLVNLDMLQRRVAAGIPKVKSKKSDGSADEHLELVVIDGMVER
jgi:hypothetical protein